MGNVIGSFFSGFAQVAGNLLGHPLDFLSGKSCDTVCGPTWDVLCYIENFCIWHLLKLVMVATLVYLVLLFFYLVYKLGICQCVCHSCCRMIWAFCSTYFSALEFCCSYLCYKLRTVNRRRRRRRRDIEEGIGAISSCTSSESRDDFTSTNLESTRTRSRTRRNYKEEHLRRSLRPTSHRARVGIAHSSIHFRRRKSMNNVDDRTSHLHHHIRVTRSSRFAQKGSRHRSRIQHRRR